ncbi:MAG: serine hydrolase domain-containing protein [Peristeroidobacter soli]
MIHRYGTILALLFGLCSVPTIAAPADEFDRYVQTQIQRQHIPGVAIGIVRAGRVVKMRGYGLANVELGVPAAADTVFEIGSVTKSFTSMAVLLLQERGRVSLDNRVDQYLANIPVAWKAVTLRQLLSHTSGVPDYEEVMGYDSYRNIMTPEQVIAVVSGKPLDFPPGTEWKYSNTGYYLLTLVIEKVSGEKYADFVTRNILAPAGLTHTRASDPGVVIPHRAAGYEYRDGFHNRDPIQPSATGGAGMLVSTVADMARWAAVIGKQEILKPESYASMLADNVLANGSRSGYGFGWFVSPMRGHRAFAHSGGTAGFSCNLLHLPDDDVTIVVLTNSGNANPLSLTDHFARVLVPALRYTAIPDPHPEVGMRLLDYFAHRTDAEPYVSAFTPEFAKVIAEYWTASFDYYRAIGAPVGVELVERLPEEERVRYRVRYEDVARLVLLKLDAAGRIAEASGSEE